MSELEGRIAKLKTRQLALAARITVANSLLLGSLRYLIVIWAGKRIFLSKLQKVIDGFIWAGRSRVARAMVSLPKEDGGLGIIGPIRLPHEWPDDMAHVGRRSSSAQDPAESCQGGF